MRIGVLFDLDGTLIDTPRGIVETFENALEHLGVTSCDETAIRMTIGLPLDRAFGILLGVPADDAQVGEGMAHYQKMFRQIVLPRARALVFPGVREGLAMLRSRGVTLAVVTSKVTASAEALLAASGLRNMMSLVVGADQVVHPKPDPEMADLACRALGLSPKHTVVVGDTTHDVQMARAARMRSIAVTYGVHDVALLRAAQPTWVAGSFNEVFKLLFAGTEGRKSVATAS